MLNKKIMILAIFLVSLLAVSAVSAGDNATSDVISADNIDDVIEEPIGEAPADEVGADNPEPTGTIQDDFNVWISNETLDIDKDKDKVVINFTSPENAEGDVDVYLCGRYTRTVEIDNSTVGKTLNITLNDLWIQEYGEVPVLLKYLPNSGVSIEIGTGTFTVVKYYSPDDFDRKGFDFVSSVTYRAYSFSAVPTLGTLIMYVDGERRCSEYIDEKYPSRQYFVSDLNITENGIFNIRTEYIVQSTGQVIELDDFNVTVNIDWPVMLFIQGMPINVADEYSSPYLGQVFDKNYVQGSVTGYIDGHQVFNKQYSVSDAKSSIMLEGFTYYDGFTLGNHTVKIVYMKNDGKQYTKEGIVTFYAEPKIISPYNVYEGEKKYITVSYYKGSTGNMVVYNAERDSSSPTGWKRGDVFMTFDLNGNGTVSVPLESFHIGYHGLYLNITLGTYNTESYADFNVIEVPDSRIDPDLTISVNDITFGNDAVVIITTNNTFSGKVSVEIGEIKFDVDVKNGTGSSNVSSLNASDSYYEAEAFFNATDVFKSASDFYYFKVKKAWSAILFYDAVIDLDSGDSLNLTINTKGAIGITAKIDGNNATVDGYVILIPALSVGNHTLEIVTKVDNNHLEDSKEVTIVVAKVKSSVIFDKEILLIEGSSVNVPVTTEGAIGFDAIVKGYPNAVNITGDVITISGLNEGNYTLSVTTRVDDDHISVTENGTITVKNEESEIVVPDIIFDYGASGTSAVIGLTNINATINDNKAIVGVEDNVITVSGLDAGNYTLTVKGNTPSNRSATKEATVTVNKVDSSINVRDISFDYGNSGSATVTLSGADDFIATIDGHADAVSISVNKISVSGLGAGKYTLTVVSLPDANHNSATKDITITVNKLKTVISAPKVNTVYGTSKNIVVTLKDAKGNVLSGKMVSVKLNGVTYNNKKTNSKGQISIAVPKNLVPKTYVASIAFAGDTNYVKSTGSVNVVVKKATPKITAKAKAFKKSVKTKKYSITLKTNLNKVMKNTKVTIKVNKKTYSAKTNNKGVATFKITKLTKKGKFTAQIKYAGSKYYNAKTVKVKITVK